MSGSRREPDNLSPAEAMGIDRPVIAADAPAADSLAVFTTQLGASFISRHVLDLAPGRAIVVAGTDQIADGGFWTGSCPAFYVDRHLLRLRARLARRMGATAQEQVSKGVEAFLRRHNAKVALGEFLDSFLDFAPILDRMGVPYVVQSHGRDASAAIRDPAIASRYLAYRSARAVLTRCDLHRRRLIDLGLPADKVHVSHGGIDVPAAMPVRPEGAGKRLLAIGYMTSKKSPIYVLEAFRRAVQDDPVLRLDYVGGGPLLPAAKHFVHATGLQESVNLHGVAPEEVKLELLHECGVFVQHSLTDPDSGDEEGLPASIQEAMAHGLAVISTRHAGIPEALEDGVSGLLVEEGDVARMARLMVEVPKRARDIGTAAHSFAAANHDWRFERARLLEWLGL